MALLGKRKRRFRVAVKADPSGVRLDVRAVREWTGCAPVVERLCALLRAPPEDRAVLHPPLRGPCPQSRNFRPADIGRRQRPARLPAALPEWRAARSAYP